MNKTLLYRLFGIGGIPKKIRPLLEAEGIRICDEGIGGWLVYKNFKAPGKRFKYRMQGFSGFLALTDIRLVSYAYGKPIINVPISDPRIAEIHSELTRSDRLELSFESSKFHADREGMITVRFNTPLAHQFHDRISGITKGQT